MTIRRCPRCNSLAVRRSRRRGLLERIVLPLLLRRPFRCEACEHRHYGSTFSQRLGGRSTVPVTTH